MISLLYASTCFEHYVLIIRRSKLYYTASGLITPVGGRPVHRSTCDLFSTPHMPHPSHHTNPASAMSTWQQFKMSHTTSLLLTTKAFLQHTFADTLPGRIPIFFLKCLLQFFSVFINYDEIRTDERRTVLQPNVYVDFPGPVEYRTPIYIHIILTYLLHGAESFLRS